MGLGKGRLGDIERSVDLWGLDAVLINSNENIRYLSGFTGSSGMLLITPEGSYILTDFRYKRQAEEEVAGVIVISVDRLVEGLAELVAGAGIELIGFEGSAVAYDLHHRLKESLPSVTFRSISEELEKIRSVKEPWEITLIRSAIEIAVTGFELAEREIGPGISERDIANLVEFEVKRCGAEAMAFDIIVASGKRSALPHGKPTNKLIESGDLVVVDMGITLNGYNSDETRTYVVGSCTPRQKRIYDIVREAQCMAIDAIAPGVKAADIDSIARNYIKSHRMERYFGHGTGHGVGIAIHESPLVSQRSKDILAPGMVFTVEPGIYIEDWGGVRIEDMVLVTGDGCDILTSGDRDMLVLLN